MKIKNKRELPNIAINHSADFDYKDFLKIYWKCTRELYSFLRFGKNCVLIIKMTVTDQIKILGDKIKSNEAQYDLGWETDKISVLSSKDLLEKFEYLTGEDLGHRLGGLEKTKFEYSPLGMALPNNTKNKRKTNRVDSKKKQDKYLVYSSQHSFSKLKDIDEFKELSLDSMYKKLNDFKKNLISLKILIHKQIKIKS